MKPTRDELIRLTKEAGVIDPSPYVGAWENQIFALERFYHLAIADFLQRTGQYVTNDASREAALAEAANAAYLAGQREMKERAEAACRVVKVHIDGYHQYTAHKVRGECSLAVQRLVEATP